MFEMDKESFGQFLAQHRKEQGMTQKQLAERLFVSDKAVSKWERGLSLPDVSLLLPLSQLLGVSVTELLEGRQLEEPMAPEEVETLVQKALQYPEIPPEVQRLQRRRRLCIYLGAAAIALTECVVLYFAFGMQMLPAGLTLELLAMIFGGFSGWGCLSGCLPTTTRNASRTLPTTGCICICRGSTIITETGPISLEVCGDGP